MARAYFTGIVASAPGGRKVSTKASAGRAVCTVCTWPGDSAKKDPAGYVLTPALSEMVNVPERT